MNAKLAHKGRNLYRQNYVQKVCANRPVFGLTISTLSRVT